MIETLEYLHTYLEDEAVEEKYEAHKQRIETKINNQRYTYLCQRKEEFDNVIKNIQKDNADMAANIHKAKSMIDAIFDVTEDEQRIENVLNKLASDCIRIDEKRPDFGSIVTSASQQIEEVPQLDELVPNRIRTVEVTKEKVDYLSDQMNSFYYSKDNQLWVKEIDGDTISDLMVMPLKLYLQKVITVPYEAGNKVFLLGGSKDLEGKDAVSNCYEVELDKKTLIPIQKMSTPRLSMACGISPDCQYVIIAGGSEGDNKPTNSSEIFDVAKKTWRNLPALNCPRMSASLIVCTGENVYCFGGIESDPLDPSKFVPLRSIEWLDYGDKDGDWETLKIKIPFKGSSMGAIGMSDHEFLIFGGWNRKTFDKSAFVWMNAESGYCIEDGPELAEPDTFVSTGLMFRDLKKRECIFFGVNHTHVYDEVKESFKLFGH